MKLRAVELARSIWLFDTRLLNQGGRSMLEPLEGLSKRYRFAKAPKHQLDFNQSNALVFEKGIFRNAMGIDVDLTLHVFADGIWADSLSSSEDSDAFLVDVLKWLKDEYALALPPGTPIRKGYTTRVEVETPAHLSALTPKLNKITDMLADKLISMDNKPRIFDVGGLGMWCEDAGKVGSPAQFRIERKIGTAFEENIYLSLSPLKSGDHLELLSELERILT
jgi:hypothetical protein